MSSSSIFQKLEAERLDDSSSLRFSHRAGHNRKVQIMEQQSCCISR